MSQSPGFGFASISRVTGLKSVCAHTGLASMLTSAPAASKEALTIDCLPLISFVLAPPWKGEPSRIEIQSKDKHNRRTQPANSARARSRRRSVCGAAGNKRTFMMHKAFRIGLAAYALAGGGAVASAQDRVEAGAQLYEEHCMGCNVPRRAA